MEIARNIATLREQVSKWREYTQKIALVPTMGALHEGHLSLVRQAKITASRVVVSLFVNPTQFLPGEDFAKYPRDEKRDTELLESVGADLLYTPSVTEMYPPSACTTIQVRELSRRWEGQARPGHFDGVATIVAKLLIQAAPDVALFGEKDYQQLQVIKRLTRDLDLPVTIIGCPIIRDEFGLALSSRNVYLTDDQLKIARTLNRSIAAVAIEAQAEPTKLKDICDIAASHLQEEGFTTVDYLSVVNAQTLEPLIALDQPARVLVAARIKSIRLLDNMAVGP